MGKFYVTTPIYYVNDKPHIGHAYTTILADILARWHRLKGDDVLFLTGTDEHGGKVQKAAADAGQSPQEFVDRVVEFYKSAWKALDISYDKFIRTTDDYHVEAVKAFIRKLWDAGDIFKSKYEGWYCLPDETFIPESEVKDGKCPHCGRPVQKLQEDAYFFSLSKYKDTLLRIFTEDKGFVIPNAKANEMLSRLNGEVKDLDITRQIRSVEWGVKFPVDESQTVYVWVDALINYISALGWPNGDDFKKFWPADVHLVGKEILWFHSVIWPAMLMSAGLQLPKTVLAHGWWTADGQKMSKSLGNFIDPVETSKKYSVDALRYFLVKEMPVGEDGDFSEKSLVARINGELVADLGNLVSRVLTLAEKYSGEMKGEIELDANLDLGKISDLFEGYKLTEALEEVWKFIRSINKYFNDKEPWKLEGDALSSVLNNSLEALRVIAILIEPFMPSTSKKIKEQLGIGEEKLDRVKFGRFTGKVKRGENIFTKVEV